MSLICRICNADVIQATNKGNYLKRVNEYGVDGVWECSPSCDDNSSTELAVINAILNSIDDSVEIIEKLNEERKVTPEIMNKVIDI